MHSFYCLWQRKRLVHFLLAIPILLLTACAGVGNNSTNVAATPTFQPRSTSTLELSPGPNRSPADICPGQLKNTITCQTPHSMRVAYGMESLTEQGMTGKGQTVVDIVSFGSPTLQQDINTFDLQFGLPPITLKILSPIGTAKPDPTNNDMNGWAVETTLDVEIIHAMAPDAGIVVLTSPVDETEGTIGLPQFLQLEQYAVDHHLGQIFSQSYVASETTLADKTGRHLVQTYADFYKKATTEQGWTILSGSGDHGATDYSNVTATTFSSTPIVNFPADVPWVTGVGGTTLAGSGANVKESAWNGSGGGFSKFFSEPDFQQGMPQNQQSELKGQRGLPDIAANADPLSAMAVYVNGGWQQVGGTSAATPTWAAIIAVANQMAGHPLGFINPALYKIATSGKAATDFRDITTGDNSFSEGNVRVQGFPAAAGWDPITGWGTPICDKLLPDLIATQSNQASHA